MKQCTKCKKIKPSSEFGIDNSKSDGLHSRCKICGNIETKEWQKRNKCKIRFDNIKRHAIVHEHMFNIPKDIGLALISSPCAYCGQIQETFNGLDRIDSNKEYELDNITPCCTKCNRAKNTMAVNEFKIHIIKMFNYITR